MKLEGTAPAPDLPEGLEWLNALRPISLGELRGKIVLLDFWCFCCINCMHIIPELDRLERDFPDELVVIGVHSAKFDGEKDSRAIRQAMERHGIRHMVVNDRDMRIWEEYAVHAWPSLVLIDPAGNIVARASGEHIYEPFKEIIGEMVEHWDGLGQLDRTSLGLAALGQSAPGRVLSFPGKLAADEDGGRLFISDSGNHRILVSSLDGELQAVIGSGDHGLRDGPADTAKFNRPQGMCYDPHDDVLFVADTQNHAIRLVDLNQLEVTTLAGDGMQSSGPEDGPGSATGRLASPWDVCLYNGLLYIAMAGTHQIWQLDPASGNLALTTGSGRENMVDGPPGTASLSQPSGLAMLSEVLYVADAENSAVRAVAIGGDRSVSTVTGAGLFEFGDRDGALGKARLQHCIGICGGGGGAAGATKLYIADSYNNKIKLIDLGAQRIATLCGSGERGLADGNAGQAQFNEPNDVLLAAGKLYVADTNNHAIRVVNPATGLVSMLQLSGLEKLAAAQPVADARELALTLPPGASTLELRLRLPEGTKLNPAAPFNLAFAAENPAVLSVGSAVYDGRSVTLPLALTGDGAELSVSGPVYYCAAGNEGLCYVGRVNVRIAFTADNAAQRTERRTIEPDAG